MMNREKWELGHKAHLGGFSNISLGMRAGPNTRRDKGEN